MAERRYLLQTKKNKKGRIKRFIFNWTPALSLKRDLREVTKTVADAILSGNELPIENDIRADLPDDVIAVHIKKDFIKPVLDFIDTLEDAAKITLNATANFPDVTMATEDKVEPLPDSADEVKAINSIPSKNGIEKYIKSNDLAVTVLRTDSLIEMKKKVIACL